MNHLQVSLANVHSLFFKVLLFLRLRGSSGRSQKIQEDEQNNKAVSVETRVKGVWLCPDSLWNFRLTFR